MPSVIDRMIAVDDADSIVTLLCDGGERYGCTYYNDAWLADRGRAGQGAGGWMERARPRHADEGPSRHI